MKKFFLIVLIIVGLAAVGLAIFIATFDADRYRPQLVTQLERALGKPVALERLSLGWRNGIALRLQGLRIAQDETGRGEPLLEAEDASAVVQLGPLLKKEFQISSVAITRPTVHVARDAQGRINLLGLAAVASPAAASGAPRESHQPPAFQIDSFRIQDGRIHWSDAQSQPPRELWLNALGVTVSNIAPGKPMDVEIRGALASERVNFRLRGQVNLPHDDHPGSVEQLRVNLDQLAIESVLPPLLPNQPSVRGLLSAEVEGAVPTLDSTQLTRRLLMSGTIRLAEARVVNLNILRTVFEKIAIIPGLVEKLQAELPPTYQEKLAASDTALSPIEASIRVSDGVVRFEELQISTDTLRLQGSGTVGLDGVVQIRSLLGIEPTLSAAMVKSVNELGALANAEGELEMPALIQGRAPHVSVLPDTQYLASKIVVNKAMDFLGTLLEKQRPEEAEAAQPGEPESAPSSEEEDPWGALLQRAIQRAVPPDKASP